MYNYVVFLRLIFIIFTVCNAFSLEIFITKGTIKPIVFSFVGQNFSKNSMDRKTPESNNILEDSVASAIRQVVVSDLMNSGMFKTGQAAQSVKEIFSRLDVDLMRAQEVKISVGCAIEQAAEDKVIVRVKIVHDVGDVPEIVDLRFQCNMDNLRLLSHHIANAIYQVAWSIPGDFDSQIVYVDKQQGNNALVLMDRDGSNSTIIDQSSIISTPSVSKDGRYVCYAKHVGHFYCLFLYDRKTGSKEQLTEKGKICYSPVFSKDGSFLVFSMSAGGSTSLYRMNLANKQINRLTFAKGWIDTTPAFTASGKELIMISDRSKGTPKPYVYGIDNGYMKQIQTAGGAYYDPACCTNPFNKDITQVCFFKRKGGMAYLGMFLLDNNFDTLQEKLLWQGPRLYAPSWGINGTSVIFSTNTQLKRINIFTGATEILTTFGKPNTPVVSVRPAWEQTVNIRIM